MQSPIDLHQKRVEVLPNMGCLKREYKPAKLNWGESGAGTLEINHTEYVLKQCHWHSPSEHTFNGRRYSLEMHLVHESKQEKRAVIAFAYKIEVMMVSLIRFCQSRLYNRFLNDLWPGLDFAQFFRLTITGSKLFGLAHIRVMGNILSIADSKDADAQTGVVDPRHIKMGSRKYYRYMGSLTTPPCTQGVAWNVVKKVNTIYRQQLSLLRPQFMKAEANARPTQPINKRKFTSTPQGIFELFSIFDFKM
ncbi:hypothetical protein AMTRI_Chr04g249620 [Amborella trichopoda]